MSKTTVLKKYSGTFAEQLQQYRDDRSQTDFLFKQECDAARYPAPKKKVTRE
jgi:hypothetical protein